MRWVFKLITFVVLIVSLSSCGGHWDSYSSGSRRRGAKVQNANGKSSKRKSARRTSAYSGGGNKTRGIFHFNDSYGSKAKSSRKMNFKDSYGHKRNKKRKGKYRDTYRNKKSRDRRSTKKKLRKRSQKGVFQ